MVSTVPSVGSAIGSATVGRCDLRGACHLVLLSALRCLFSAAGCLRAYRRAGNDSNVRSINTPMDLVDCRTPGVQIAQTFDRTSVRTDARSEACRRARGTRARGRRRRAMDTQRCTRPAVGGSGRRRARRPTAFRGSRSAALRPGRSRCSTGARPGLRRGRARCDRLGAGASGARLLRGDGLGRPAGGGRRAPARPPCRTRNPRRCGSLGGHPRGHRRLIPHHAGSAAPRVRQPSAEGRGHRPPS